MRTRILGRTGLAVSELSLGTVELGLDYGIAAPGETLKPGEQQAAMLLHTALDRGINLIDTARAYGESERIVGSVLQARRREFVLLTKVRPGTAAEVRRQVEESLSNLQTDAIDILMIHSWADQVEPHAETVGELLELQRSGEIRFIGSSIYGVAAAKAAIESGWFDCIEIAYNPIDRSPEALVLETARRVGVGVIARSVLLKGALTARYRHLPVGLEALQECVEDLARIAGSITLLPEMAYRYVLSHEPPQSVLVGTASTAELDACIQYAEQGPLSADQMAAIRTVTLDDERWLNPGNWPGDRFPKPYGSVGST